MSGKIIQNGSILAHKRTLYNLPGVSQGNGISPLIPSMNSTIDALSPVRLFLDELKNWYLPSLGTTVDTGQTLLPTLSLPFVKICERQQKIVDFLGIWDAQEPPQIFIDSLAVAAKFVNERIVHPPSGISNVTEWCKKDACWTRLQSEIETLKDSLPAGFWGSLVSLDENDKKMREAKKTQKIDNGIDAQKKSLEIGSERWTIIYQGLSEKGDLSPKEAGILKIAQQIPNKVPSEKQSMILMEILEKARTEGLFA